MRNSDVIISGSANYYEQMLNLTSFPSFLKEGWPGPKNLLSFEKYISGPGWLIILSGVPDGINHPVRYKQCSVMINFVFRPPLLQKEGKCVRNIS
jgi:hypothetical protein